MAKISGLQTLSLKVYKISSALVGALSHVIVILGIGDRGVKFLLRKSRVLRLVTRAIITDVLYRGEL